MKVMKKTSGTVTLHSNEHSWFIKTDSLSDHKPTFHTDDNSAQQIRSSGFLCLFDVVLITVA